MKALRILLIIVAIVCIGVAVSYPIRYKMELDSATEEFESLSDMRKRVLAEEGLADGSADASAPENADEPGATAETEAASPDITEETTPPEAEEAPESIDEPAENPTRPAIKWGTKAPETSPETISAEGPEPDAANVAEEPTQIPVESEVPTEEPTQAPVEHEAVAEEPTQIPVESEVPVEELNQAADVNEIPTEEPTEAPIVEEVPTEEPTEAPVVEEVPTEEPTEAPIEEDAAASPGSTLIPKPTPTPEPTPTPTPSPTPFVDIMDYLADDSDFVTPSPTPTPTPKPTPSPTPTPSITPEPRDTGMAYLDKPKVTLDEDRILPELKEIYALNHDLVGWLYIEDTNIDYPVVQHSDRQYYLRRDFYGKDNANGQIILDTGCDPYTPSYNLIISGHHMNSGAMFGRLQVYKDASFWQTHKIVEFDSLMERKKYVVFAAFYSADYDENEEGFRYSVNIQYKMDYRHWIDEIESYRIYPTGIDVQFGDEFITLTTCDHSRRSDGRFVVVARRIREGEIIV